ncbi:MAG TPA: shikimate dehydrogenase [Chloroflexus aurantiacus]|uniref:Shikimate dehydrogenase (NADP(+)) n=1 Tax=Chloroflexus aurantiacus (strain ATCC 29366 / DSM 635 / J-10-fl) TaxID=324602 RepID=A9WE00_CHLAA|nr:shikimate dehydrogenase [Chloroflexus aurantiacus]ABY35159.1 shikimate 5-dehydrogenase [Chloroflexus aurantiacus J-10-fl]RMG52360.1 MAG: shikimate dehydrogenase [Chloroflexota bacterium]GIV92442.1 MAG: shikimate dehydrogenase (NADP(+)) [Chloroflexus sp.]HBW68668.1 shikimate dehydrogenase [Chloroflexus aurantiacus]
MSVGSTTTAEILLIGDPVAHSRSPAMHNAALAALGIAARYRAVQTTAAELPDRLAALRQPHFLGANVTLPHKQAVIPLLDEIEPAAARIGAVNTIVRQPDGRLLGVNTDAPGLLADLAAAGWTPVEQEVVILGASGAARAATFALADAGVNGITIVNRSLMRAIDLAAAAAANQPALRIRALSLSDPAVTDVIAHCTLLINATALGWHDDETPIADPPVGAHCLVYDMVYRETALLRAAVARGARVRDGRGMLVEQGALAFERWTGRPAPREIMWQAAFGVEHGP